MITYQFRGVSITQSPQRLDFLQFDFNILFVRNLLFLMRHSQLPEAPIGLLRVARKVASILTSL